jgi:hypothetical protein
VSCYGFFPVGHKELGRLLITDFTAAANSDISTLGLVVVGGINIVSELYCCSAMAIACLTFSIKYG